MKTGREFYYPKDARIEYPAGLPKGYEIHRYENGSMAPDSDTPFAAVFSAGRTKPDWEYRFANTEEREEDIANWIAARKERENETDDKSDCQ